MKYGYARVSTVGQELETQVIALEKEKCDKIYSEKFTGASLNRPRFKYVLHLLQPGDTLVVTKLDRMARNTHEALKTIQKLFDRGIRIHILNMGIIENAPTGSLIFTIFSAFAEYERDMILTRTQEGKYLARLNNPNFHEGRPKKYSRGQIQAVLKLLESQSFVAVEKQTGISQSTLRRAINRLPDEKKALYRKERLRKTNNQQKRP